MLGRLVRWHKALILRLLGQGRHQARSEVRHHLAVLRNITGLTIQLLGEDSSEPANVRVFFLATA